MPYIQGTPQQEKSRGRLNSRTWMSQAEILENCLSQTTKSTLDFGGESEELSAAVDYRELIGGSTMAALQVIICRSFLLLQISDTSVY